MRIQILLIICIGVLSACSSEEENSSPVQQIALARAIFSDSVTQFNVAVYYEPGAEPYVGNLALTNDTWDVTSESYKALFSSHPARTVSVPATLGAMTAFEDQNKTSWSTADLITLGQRLAPTYSSGTTITMPVIFLNGRFNGSDSILGVQLSGLPHAFIFKDVITGIGGGAVAQRYIEQATVVHEIGHAVGLVNNGIPLRTAHEDGGHVHHTTNQNCVMYWAVESSSDILGLLTNFIAGNSLNLFGAQSLQDGRDFHP